MQQTQRRGKRFSEADSEIESVRVRCESQTRKRKSTTRLAAIGIVSGLTQADWGARRQRKDTPRQMLGLRSANEICLTNSSFAALCAFVAFIPRRGAAAKSARVFVPFRRRENSAQDAHTRRKSDDVRQPKPDAPHLSGRQNHGGIVATTMMAISSSRAEA